MALPAGVDELLSLVAKYTRTRRLSLKEQFEVKDPMRHGRITASMFAQVVQLIGVHLAKVDIDALASAFNDPSCNFVDYPRFVAAVNERVGQIFGDRAATSVVVNQPQPYALTKSGYVVERTIAQDASLPALHQRVHNYITRRRIRLYEFFQGFDDLRKGKVTLQKFGTACSQAGIELTDDDLATVRAGYGDPVDYRQFCNEVDSSFDLTGLEKTPTVNPSTLVKPLTRDFQAGESTGVENVILKLKTLIQARRMNIRDQFYDYDKAPRKGFISAQQLKQAIARLGLPTPPRELTVLAERFKVSAYGDVDYRAFCDAVDPPAP